MPIDIDSLTYEELIALNHRIVARLKFLDDVQAQQEMIAFALGARVSFEAGRGHGRQTGMLVKFNRKTVKVLTDDGREWNVSPHLLSPVKDVEPATTIATRANQSFK